MESLEDRSQPALLAAEAAFAVPDAIPAARADLLAAAPVRLHSDAAGAVAVPAAPAAEPPADELSPWAWSAVMAVGVAAVWSAWESSPLSQTVARPDARSWREYLLGLDLDRS